MHHNLPKYPGKNLDQFLCPEKPKMAKMLPNNLRG